MKKRVFVAAAVFATVGGVAYSFSGYGDMKEPVVFYAGHTHGPDGHAIDAPEHSGGLNRAGCHNASVPYHCH